MRVLRPCRQRGVAALILLVLLGMGAVALLVNVFNSSALRSQRDKITAAALAQAKEALVGRAVRDDNRPGSLPCPDTNNDGSAELFSGNQCPIYLGRLPWRTLGLPDLRDGSGERLWYALSRNFRDRPEAQPINSDSVGQLTIIGSSPQNNVIAIVFAPGPPLPGQVRDPASQNDRMNYLEGENANADPNNTIYRRIAAANDSFNNDRLLALTGDSLFPVVEFRVAGEIRSSLGAYFAANNYYPFANDYGDGSFNCTPLATRGRVPLNISSCSGLAEWGASPLPNWFSANNWHLLTYYTVAPACTSATPNCSGSGFLTVNNTHLPDNDKRVLVAVTGRAFPWQVRPCAGVADCLEGAENVNLDDTYSSNPVSGSFNDKLAWLPRTFP